MYLASNGPCLGCLGNTQSGLGATQSGLGNTQSGLGDLSFDGTGILGTGLFGYSPWYNTSLWTGAEWAAVGIAGWFALWRLQKMRGKRR